MALGMKHWVGLVLAGCAFVALELLPVSSWELRTTRPSLPEEAYEKALRADIGLANTRLTRIRIAKRMIPLTLATEGPLAFGVPAGADPQEARRVREEAEREARDATADTPRVSLGLFYVDRAEESYPGLSARLSGRGEYYFGTRDGRAYCVTTLPVWSIGGRIMLEGVGYTSSRLGLCQVIARYGVPGPAAEAWLARGGTAMATTLEPSDTSSFTFSSLWGLGFARRVEVGIMLWDRPPLMSGRTVALERCFAGVAEGCATLFLEPGSEASVRTFGNETSGSEVLQAATPLSAIQSSSAMWPADSHVVADLVEEFGVERFERWWTAEGSTDQAFLAAFGVPAGEWYARRVARLITVVPPGPSLRPNGLAWSVVILALAAVIGGAWARRRTVA